MSLLEKIAERNAQTAKGVQQAEQREAEVAAMPDAGETARERRSSYSNALAAGPDEMLGEEQPTPEEQQQFTKVERLMAEAVYGARAADSIVKMVKTAQDPVEGVGKAAADLVASVSKRVQMSEDVMFAAGESAVEQIVDLVEASDPGIDLTEDQMAEALSIGVTSWMEKNEQSIDPEMMQYLSQKPPAQL